MTVNDQGLSPVIKAAEVTQKLEVRRGAQRIPEIVVIINLLVIPF